MLKSLIDNNPRVVNENIPFIVISNDSGTVVVGGSGNTACTVYTVVGGGQANVVSGCYSFLGGGFENSATGRYGSLPGGRQNTIGPSALYSTIKGGYNNTSINQYSSIVGTNNISCHDSTHILGDSIITNRNGTTFINQLSIVNLPDGSAGLPSKAVYYCSTDSNRIYFVP